MRHAAHKANKDSVQRTSPSALFRSSRGSHTARAVRAVQAANGDAVALANDPVFAAKLNEVAPMTRRAIRETAKAAPRQSYMMSSASLAALVGTAATALAFSNIQQSSNSRLLADDPATTTTQLARETGSTRMPASCPKDSTRTMPRATAVSPMRSASARGGRTCVAISSACPSDHISAMVRTGRTPLVRTATGWTTRLATRATSWCSARARKARVPCMAMSPSWRASTLTARSPSRSAALR